MQILYSSCVVSHRDFCGKFEHFRATGQSPYAAMASGPRRTAQVGNRTANATMLSAPATKKRKVDNGPKYYVDGKGK